MANLPLNTLAEFQGIPLCEDDVNALAAYLTSLTEHNDDS